jgi:hypothetical protein
MATLLGLGGGACSQPSPQDLWLIEHGNTLWLSELLIGDPPFVGIVNSI